jgi:hypothetical protein
LCERALNDADSEDLMDGTSDTNTPSVIVLIHPNRFATHYAGHIAARAGFHQADTVRPIDEGAWATAQASIDVALAVDGFRHADDAVGRFVERTGILREGGYASPEPGENLAEFLETVDD